MREAPTPGRGGFTLIELLVVVVIIVILAAISVGGWRMATTAAKARACASNLRAIGSAINFYAGDHGGDLPATSHTERLENAWIFQLEDYLGKFDEQRISPSDPRGEERLAAGGTSYLLNSFLVVPAMDPFGNPVGRPMNNILRIPQPTNTPLAFTCADRTPPGPGNDHTHSESWTSWGAVLADISPYRHGGSPEEPDKGKTNILYADARVVTWRAEELKERTLAGENIARPPGTDQP